MIRSTQQALSSLSISNLPVCVICYLTEQAARCDILNGEKQKCNLTMCKKCIEANPERVCDQGSTGCKKKVKEHRMKNHFKDKVKNSINLKFDQELNLRNKYKLEKKYADLDEDITFILGALLGESAKVFNSTYRKDIDKLVEELENMKNTVESQMQRGSLPVFKQQIYSNDTMIDNGKVACGYADDDHSKGISHILNAFN